MWFDATTGDPLGSALDNPGPVVSLALDNDGQRAGVVVDWGQNNYRFLWWNIALGKAVGPSPANGPAVFGAEGALLQGLGNPATILLADSGSNGAILLREEIPWTGGWLGQTEELVTLARGHELRIRNGRTGAASSEALLAATHVEDVVASPDGKHLLQIDISREITVLSTDRMPIQAAVPALHPCRGLQPKRTVYRDRWTTGRTHVAGSSDGWIGSSPVRTERPNSCDTIQP
jgi:hypothetical protein